MQAWTRNAIATLAALGALATAAPAYAQVFTGHADTQLHQARPRVAPPPRTHTPLRQFNVESRYVAIPVSIRADDETGYYWTGSDEVYAIFRDPSTNSAVRTPTVSMDEDDVHVFAQANACLAPIGQTFTNSGGQPVAWQCRAEGLAAIAFTVELYESDGPRSVFRWGACLAPLGDGPEPECSDDLMGRATLRHTRADLGALAIGQQRTFSVRIGGYSFAYRIQRVADVRTEQRPSVSR